MSFGSFRLVKLFSFSSLVLSSEFLCSFNSEKEGPVESRVWDPVTRRERRKAVFSEETEKDNCEGSDEEESDEEGESKEEKPDEEEEEDDAEDAGEEAVEHQEEEEDRDDESRLDKGEVAKFERKTVKEAPSPMKRQKLEENGKDSRPVVEMPAFADSDDDLEKSGEEESEEDTDEEEMEEEKQKPKKRSSAPPDSGHCSEEDSGDDDDGEEGQGDSDSEMEEQLNVKPALREAARLKIAPEMEEMDVEDEGELGSETAGTFSLMFVSLSSVQFIESINHFISLRQGIYKGV